jgi:hypothetical protein
LQQPGDARRDRIELDAGDMGDVAQASGISAGNSPVPMPGSSARRASRAFRPDQIARTMNSGVKWAYWVQRASEA